MNFTKIFATVLGFLSLNLVACSDTAEEANPGGGNGNAAGSTSEVGGNGGAGGGNGAAGGGSGAGGGDQTIPDYLKKKWGITISGFSGEFGVDEDGSQFYTGEGKISVDGLGSSDISIETIVDSAANGGATTFFVKNVDGSNERYFLYDRVENYITIGDLTKGTAISKNPDGTYEIWAFEGETKEQFLTAPDGYEALKIVEQYNGFKGISPYILLTAIAVAHTSTPEARFVTQCTVSNTAETPVVCDIFEEFCECAACLVLERQGKCEACPKL